ncbi:hypothetical protein EAS68_00055 [Legionella jordanis]|nr:hypothetical protein EAS68_00055 [Legionella jordanis]
MEGIVWVHHRILVFSPVLARDPPAYRSYNTEAFIEPFTHTSLNSLLSPWGQLKFRFSFVEF